MKDCQVLGWVILVLTVLSVTGIVSSLYQKQIISQQQVTITGLESALEANKYHLQECLKDARVGYSEFTGE
jgi:hypothetical protein